MMQARWIGVLLLVALALSWAAAPVAGDAGITEHRPATRPLDPSATAVPSLTTDRSSSLTPRQSPDRPSPLRSHRPGRTRQREGWIP